MNKELALLTPEGLQKFRALGSAAVSNVTDRFYASHATAYAEFGDTGRLACSEDLAFHLEFMTPVLEFGLVKPMVDYLHWLGSVLAAREIPAGHLALSLQWLAEFYDGHLDGADRQVADAAFSAVLASFQAADPASEATLMPPTPWPQTARFEAAMLAGDQQEALAVMSSCLDDGASMVDFECHVIQPALYSVGDKWQANQVSVAQEHMATAIAQSVMTIGLLRSPPATPLGKSVLLACVEGNHHTVGLRMVADAFQVHGWQVTYLGADVPVSAVVKQVLVTQPDLVGLSVSFPQQLRSVKLVIEEMKGRLGGARPSVVIGGLAINRFTGLVQVTGADGYSSNAKDAVVHADQLVLSPSRP